MKTTEFKVRTTYSKEDILRMEKVSCRKSTRINLAISIAVFVLYLAVVIWEDIKGQGHVSLFSFIPGSVLDVVLLAALLFSIILMVSLPYFRRRDIMKAAPQGGLKANYYFYEKTFQYGWGSCYSTIAYMDIEDFVNLPNTFFFKANDLNYWVKKTDFEVGTPEEFYEFMKSRVRCKIIDKSGK